MLGSVWPMAMPRFRACSSLEVSRGFTVFKTECGTNAALQQTKQFCRLSVHASHHPSIPKPEEKEVGKKLPSIAILFLYYTFPIYLMRL